MNNSTIKYIMLLASIILLNTSCNKARNSLSEEYFSAINIDDNIEVINEKFEKIIISDITSFIKSKETNDFKYTVKYIPTIVSLIKNNISTDTTEVSELIREYDKIDQFAIRIELKNLSTDIIKYNITNQVEYQNRVNYLANEFQNNLYMVCDGDTVNAKLYHFERIFGLSNYCTMMVQFKRNNKKDKVLVIEDGIFAGTIVKIRVPSDELNKLGYI